MYGSYFPQYNQYAQYSQYPQYPAYQSPAAMRLAQMEQAQQTPSPTTIQSPISRIQKQVQYFEVKDAKDLNHMQVNPGVVYFGLNESTEEIYSRQMDNDGNVETKTYVLKSGKQEPSTISTILHKLEEISQALRGKSDERNDTTTDATADVRGPHEQPRHESV